MNRQKGLLFLVAFVLIAGTGLFLVQFKGNQKLGQPGVKTSPLPDGKHLRVDLPEKVLDYESEWIEADEVTRTTLPADTSFGQRRYKAPDGFVATLNVVLMGGDRSSLHKPQFCLEGQGMRIDQVAAPATSVRVERPCAYELPVVKLVATKEVTTKEGQKGRLRAVYVYWYVADGALSASVGGYQRMWWMARELLRTGKLQRWAYVSLISYCLPGQEDAAFERMKQFVAAAAPEFQLTPGPAGLSAGLPAEAGTPHGAPAQAAAANGGSRGAAN